MRVVALLCVAFQVASLSAADARAQGRAPTPYEWAEARLGAADFEDAATYFEEAGVLQGRSCADDAFERAAHLRLLLSQIDLARTDIARYRAACGQTHGANSARFGLELAQWYASHGAWREAGAVLVEQREYVELSNESEELLAVAHAMLGQALLAERDRAGASWHFQEIVDQVESGRWEDAWWGPDGADALARARFFLAEREQKAMEEIRIPAFHGKLESRSIAAYERRVAPDWKRKRRAQRVAEAAYLRVFGVHATVVVPDPPPCADMFIYLPDVEPRVEASPDPIDQWIERAPSPRWALASLARIGEMRADMLRLKQQEPKAPYDPHTFIDPIGGRIEDDPFHSEAVHAFGACLAYASAHGLVDESSSSCERGWSWVSFRHRLPVDEIRPLAERVPPPTIDRYPRRPFFVRVSWN
jgi:hypothetical protein